MPSRWVRRFVSDGKLFENLRLARRLAFLKSAGPLMVRFVYATESRTGKPIPKKIIRGMEKALSHTLTGMTRWELEDRSWKLLAEMEEMLREMDRKYGPVNPTG